MQSTGVLVYGRIMSMRSHLRVFIIHAGTSYLLLASRFAATFVLRVLVDPSVVGVINSCQVIAPIYSALTSGTIYTALRAVPTQNCEDQSRTTWAHIGANMLEAALVIIPFMLVFSQLQQTTQTFSNLTLALIGVYVICQRFFGLLESMFMALSREAQVVTFRLLHIVEVMVALSAVSAVGVNGYLVATPAIALIMLLIALRSLPPPLLNWKMLQKSLMPTRYGTSIGAEKILSTVAASLDVLFVAFFLGPVSLAGYYLGISVRGAFSTFVNSLYWTLWPKAVKDQASSDNTVFANSYLIICIGVFSLLFSILAMLLIDWMVINYMPNYRNAVITIQVVIAGVVPLAFSEWDRARLVVEGRTYFLPIATLIKSAAFLLTVIAVGFQFEMSPLLIAIAAFVSQAIYMLIVLLMTLAKLTAQNVLKAVAMRIFFAIGPFFYFTI
jgi:O-antigen/teichoic acid export membrane protein